MIQKINFRFAINALLVLSSSTIPFHLLVLAGVIPYGIVWGGRLDNTQQMLVFEMISISINLFIIAVILMKGRYIKNFLSEKIITSILWAMTVTFALNTIGNIFSMATIETIIFTPVTFFSSILFYRLAREEKIQKK